MNAQPKAKCKMTQLLGEFLLNSTFFFKKRFKKGENMVQVNYVGEREKDFSTDIKKGT